MKLSLLIFISLTGLLLVGCVAEVETVTAVPTRIIATDTPVVVTSTAVSPTPTTNLFSHTPTSTSLPTYTPSPTITTTPQPSATPTITPTPLPPLSGELYVFWDSQIINDLNSNPIHSLYLITPGESRDHWNIETLVEEIIGHPQITLSPGKTKFAFTALEDKNGDGSISDEGYDRGFDAPNIFTYSLTNGEFARLTSEYFSGYTGWLSDNELAIGDRAINTDNLSWRQLLNQDELPDDILGSSLSSDGKFIAVNQASGQISLINTESGEVDVVTTEIGGANEIGRSDVEMAWSSDGTWLALSQPSINRLIVVNIDSQEIVQVPTVVPLLKPVWSPDNQYLAVVQQKPDESTLMLLNSSDFVGREMLRVSGGIYSLLWSPDSSQLAMATTEGEKNASLNVLDVESGDFRQLWHSTESTRFHIAAWSPDSAWLLFFNGQGWSPRDDTAGIYLIHRDGGEPYLLEDTSGSRDPIAFYWLSETNAP